MDPINCGNYENLPIYTLKSGSILYTGSKVENAHKIYKEALDNPIITTKENAFKYQGISTASELYKNVKYDMYVSFFSPNINTGIGYAGSVAVGWVNKYTTTQDIKFYDINDYLIVEEIAECICKSKLAQIENIKGASVTEYGYDNSEYAICDPWNMIKYEGTAILIKGSILSDFNNIYKFK